jgi:16S rRNA (uracil1498-N3)-methyltransferase
MGFCEAQLPLQQLDSAIRSTPDLTLLIGPEGDFTEAESQMAEKRGFHLVSLGTNRLRTETAAIFALSCFKFLRGD